jgi:hypothetical protein
MSKKLFEFTAHVRCAAVVAADTEEEARKAIETWERAWFETGDVVGVVDVDLFDVRESEDAEEEAHEVV